MNRVEKHFRKTARLVDKLSPKEAMSWMLEVGYFPEPNVLPPCFSSEGFSLKNRPNYRDVKSLRRKQLSTVTYPKTALSVREFALQDPRHYHDIAFHLCKSWDDIKSLLFHQEHRIFSYSLPIPVDARHPGELGPLRSGRMIYEWIEMAERDLVAEAHKYKFLAKADISNFYNSVYTHSIGWALHGREEALADNGCKLTASKIDRLIQYANDQRTIGIPIGPVLSDFIAEIILAAVDLAASKQLSGYDFVAGRFKDDYKILCMSESDAKDILAAISHAQRAYNLQINERKTSITPLPDGLYRPHDRDYFVYSLSSSTRVSHKAFQHTALKVLDIHRSYPGTSIMEKFVGELYDKDRQLKLTFSNWGPTRHKEIIGTISLLLLMKKESEKFLCWALAVIEDLHILYGHEFPLKNYLRDVIEAEIKLASQSQSVFELVWLLFFWRYIGLGNLETSKLIENQELRDNAFIKSIVTSQQYLFNDAQIQLFKTPKQCRKKRLTEWLDVFDRSSRAES